MALVLARQSGEIVLNGDHGEGGGQILRSGVALAAAAGHPLRIDRIRARRKPPGLRPQHLMAVRALGELCDAELDGGAVDSTRLRFTPRRPILAGPRRFSIGTAGSTALLLHALAPALCTAAPGPGPGQGPGDVPEAPAASALTLVGGTHQTLAPSAGYLQDVWAVAARALGMDVTVHLRRPGFYPRGGGELEATIGARRPAAAVTWLERAGAPRVRARAGIAHLPRHIAERMLGRVAERLAEAGVPFDPAHDGEIADHGAEPLSPGAYLELLLLDGAVPAGFLGLGEKGLPAEVVADRAVADLLHHMRREAPVDPHLADQLAILLALSTDSAESRYRTSAVTQHLLTHAELLCALWPVDIEVQGKLGQVGEVRVRPRGDS